MRLIEHCGFYGMRMVAQCELYRSSTVSISAAFGNCLRRTVPRWDAVHTLILRRSFPLLGFGPAALSAQALRQVPSLQDAIRRAPVTASCAMGAALGPAPRRGSSAVSSFQSRATTRRKSIIAQYASSNRHNATWPERVLGNAIRGRALGVTFRQQVPVGGRYIADFYAAEVGLIVEVDGPVHSTKSVADRRRDIYLARQGFTVLRVSSELVVKELAVAVERIRAEVERLGLSLHSVNET